MMGHREPMVSGDEYDALTRWRRFLRWRSGERVRIKRSFNKRMRRRIKLWLGRTKTGTGTADSTPIDEAS